MTATNQSLFDIEEPTTTTLKPHSYNETQSACLSSSVNDIVKFFAPTSVFSTLCNNRVPFATNGYAIFIRLEHLGLYECDEDDALNALHEYGVSMYDICHLSFVSESDMLSEI